MKATSCPPPAFIDRGVRRSLERRAVGFPVAQDYSVGMVFGAIAFAL